MPITDLSYAARRPQGGRGVVLAIETRGWTCGWSLVAGADRPQDCGLFSARDHVDGKPVPASHRVAGAFGLLLGKAQEARVDLVVAEPRAKPGPLWTIAPILAVALHARYAELRDWMADLNIGSDRELRQWATLVLGRPPEDEVVSIALGMGAVAARARDRERPADAG
jgi:hypothetical protein